MNYVISYWIPPDSSQQRKDALRVYFDLQKYLKQQFGATQIIVTNLDYPEAIPFEEPPGFSREYAMFAKPFGLGQLIRDGLEFPITIHDHDMFIRQPIMGNDQAIVCCSKDGHRYSDQLVVYPEISRTALIKFIDELLEFKFYKDYHAGYGTEVRHEKMYSTEVTLGNMKPNPFQDIPIEVEISSRDLVSFNILDQHSLDVGNCECDPISLDIDAVHGHLNKGQATEVLIDWLVQ